MITLQHFVKDNEGKYLEVAGSAKAKNQCVDLVNGYLRDVLGLPIIEWTNAIDFRKKCGNKYDVIFNDINNPKIVPDIGDIVVYKHPNNIGHIGVCIKKGVATQFGIFEQNWPLGSPCKSVLNKKYILGDYIVDYWLRPKSDIMSEMNTEQSKVLDILTAYMKSNPELKNGNIEGAVNALIGWANDYQNQTNPNENKKIKELEIQIENLTKKVDDIQAKYLEIQKLEANYQRQLKTANTKIFEQSQKIDQLEKESGDWQRRYNSKNDEFNTQIDTKVDERVASWINNKTAVEFIILAIKKLLIKKQNGTS
jgi:hypothetical protein